MPDFINRNELSLQACQEVSLGVLERFDQICKSNGFRYYLIYGTLIGAIRHNGFIPWDDDIDVMMPRQDFDMFVQFANKYEKELYPLKLHTRANTKNYYYGIPRFSDLTYQYINKDVWGKQIDIGAFIDIYPWDNFGNCEEDARKLWLNIRNLNRDYNLYLFSKNREDSLIKSIERKFVHYSMNVLKGGDYNKRIDQIVRDYIFANTSEDDKYIGHLVYAIGIKQFEKDKLLGLKAITHEFAGYSFCIPAAYDYILKSGYGDYMTLPPEEERQQTHLYKIIKR